MMSVTQAAPGDIATRIRILYAAASVADGQFVRTETRSESSPVAIACATTTEEALRCLEVFGPFDAVLVDPVLADGASTRLIVQIRERRPGIGIVACVASDSEDLARPALEAGADDWLPKRRDSLHRLYHVARRAIERRQNPSAAPDLRPAGEPAAHAGSDSVAERDREERLSLEATLAAREAEIAALREDLDRQRSLHDAEHSGLKEALASQRQEAAQLASELQLLRETHAAMVRDAEERAASAPHQADQEQMTATLAAREAEIASLRKELDRQRREYDAARAGLEEALASQRQDAARSAAELESLREAHAAAMARAADQTAAASDLADREHLAAALAEREVETARLTREVAERDAAQARLIEDLTSLRAAHDAAQREAKARASDAPPSHERARMHARVETGRLVLAVSEDLTSLLAAIEQAQSGMRAALTQTGLADGTVAALEKSMQQARALSLMLKAFSRREIQRARVLDVNEHVDAMRPALARLLDEDVQLDVELAPSLDPVAIHPIDLEAALVSATVAVRTHFPTGGRMTIATSQARTAADGRTVGAPGAVTIAVTAVAWRRDISIPELASDRWLAGRQAPSPDLSSLEGLLRAYGGWLDTDVSPDRLVIALSLPGIARLSILETIRQLAEGPTS